MAEAIVILIFICAFSLVWYTLLYLLRHPNINISLEPKVLAHEPELEEHISKILTYLHNEESSDFDSISHLLGSAEVANDVINLLVYRELIVVYENEDGEVVITKS